MPSRKKKGEQSPQPRRAPSHLDVRKRKIVRTARKTVRVIRHDSDDGASSGGGGAILNRRGGGGRRPLITGSGDFDDRKRAGHGCTASSARGQRGRPAALSPGSGLAGVYYSKNIVRYDNNKYTTVRSSISSSSSSTRVGFVRVRARACRLSLCARARVCASA